VAAAQSQPSPQKTVLKPSSLKDSGGVLDFDPPPTPWQAQGKPDGQVQATNQQSNTSVYQPVKRAFTTYEAADLFAGGTDSLVAKAIGSAEGTRTPNGIRTPAYYGHVDPGNGVWNLGTFSFQHGANSPEDADQKQLKRLQNQADLLHQKAIEHGMTLSLEEKLNGIDLANQAPQAALGDKGYIDWLKQAHDLGMQGAEAVIWARTRSFIDPATGTWNAPGLGNNVAAIFDDQERRANAIFRAIEAHGQNDNLPTADNSAALPPQSQISQQPVRPQTELQPPPKRQLEPLASAQGNERVINPPVTPPEVATAPLATAPVATRTVATGQTAIANSPSEEPEIPESRAFIGKTVQPAPVQSPNQPGFSGLAPGLSSTDRAIDANKPPVTTGDRYEMADVIIFQDLQ